MSKEQSLAQMRAVFERKSEHLKNRQTFEPDADFVDSGQFHQQQFDNVRLRNQIRPNSGWSMHTPRDGK